MRPTERATERIAAHYLQRNTDERVKKQGTQLYFNYYAQAERELCYTEIIKAHFNSTAPLKLLEVGAGMGGNLHFFHRLGFKWENITANELLRERCMVLKDNFPDITILRGDASQLENSAANSYDIVFQSMVLTSVPDPVLKEKIAAKMLSMVRPGGIVLWYDFSYDNPHNKEVKGIGRKEIQQLFRKATDIRFQKVTLAPPIGRRVGKAYPIFNLFPFLSTHLIAVIKK